MDDTLALTDTGADTLADARTGKNGRHRLAGLLRQSVFGRLAGYEDVNDAERAVPRPGDALGRRRPSDRRLCRFRHPDGPLRDQVALPVGEPCRACRSSRPVDRQGAPAATAEDDRARHGFERKSDLWLEGSAYKGHFGCTCYHPLFVFNQFGDVERCALRSGNVHSADGWRAVLEPVVIRYRGIVKRLYFRGDAAFANPEIYEFLEAEGIGYTIRLPANTVMQNRIGHLLKRPIGRPPHEVRRYFASFSYQAQSWKKSRRVVVKVEWHPNELYPRVGFIVTNLARPAERVVAFYNQRGTCEQYIKEGKNAIKWTRLSCRTFAANAVRLQLHALAYNLGNFMRTLAMPKTAEPWSLTSLREKLIKIGAKVVSHGRYVTFQMAEVAAPRQMFAEILSLIARLQPPPAPA